MTLTVNYASKCVTYATLGYIMVQNQLLLIAAALFL